MYAIVQWHYSYQPRDGFQVDQQRGGLTKCGILHTIKYRPAVKKKRVLLHSTTRMNLENSKPDTKEYCMIPLI